MGATWFCATMPNVAEKHIRDQARPFGARRPISVRSDGGKLDLLCTEVVAWPPRSSATASRLPALRAGRLGAGRLGARPALFPPDSVGPAAAGALPPLAPENVRGGDGDDRRGAGTFPVGNLEGSWTGLGTALKAVWRTVAGCRDCSDEPTTTSRASPYPERLDAATAASRMSLSRAACCAAAEAPRILLGATASVSAMGASAV